MRGMAVELVVSGVLLAAFAHYDVEPQYKLLWALMFVSAVAVLLHALRRLAGYWRRTLSAADWVTFHRTARGNDERDIRVDAVGRWKVPALEMVGVPRELDWAARGALGALIEHIRGRGGAVDGERLSFNGVAREQQMPHVATLRRIDGRLRVVDDGDDGVPRRFLAAHINANADKFMGEWLGERLFRQSVVLYPGDMETVRETWGEGANENNQVAYKGLGDTLFERKRTDEAIRMFREAVARSPAWARVFQEHVREHVAENASAAENDERYRWWLDIDVDKLREEALLLHRAQQRGEPG